LAADALRGVHVSCNDQTQTRIVLGEYNREHLDFLLSNVVHQSQVVVEAMRMVIVQGDRHTPLMRDFCAGK
jgi:hypothetical protein